ncbi:hypothetical protein HHI36_020937 [Cryptolaemus montrouzieri]|uniref:Luciferin 4-monooxygenase n=1 Tax=Cryptolaemus montrouzieri TaxID=559131 RepID=A0ABD2NDG7_9CUCU
MEEISDGNILEGPNVLYEPNRGGLGYEIFRSMTLNKQKIAQHIISTGESDTNEELLRRCVRTAIFMTKRELKKGDMVCLASPNHKDCMVPFIASQFVGLMYSSIEPTLPEDDLEHLFEYLHPKVLFVGENALEKIEKCMRKVGAKCELIVFGKTDRYTEFSAILLASQEEATFEPVFIEDLKETAMVSLSSGTSGKSKGIAYNHYGALAQIFKFHKYVVGKGTINLSNFTMKFDDTETPTYMFYSPMYWLSAIIMSLCTLFAGGTRIVGTIFNPEEAWLALEKYQPNTCFLPPGQANELCLFPRSNNLDRVLVNVFLTGGGLVLKTHMENLKKCFPQTKVIQAYGQTENFGIVTAFNVGKPEEMEMQNQHPDSCGKVTEGIQIKIVDDESDKICGVKQQGELRLKNRFFMNGYYKLDSSFAFDSDGWFKTGDLAYYDENGCVYIVDRLKDVLLYTVYNIKPSVIEEILAKHPAVLESLVIGLPHPKDNEHPMGVVVLRKEYERKVGEEEIINFVNSKVPSDRYKIRGGIKFVDHIVKTPSGKYKKIEMKKLIVEGKFKY